MIKGIYHSAAGMLPRYFKLVNISNNLANANTTAFKADRRYFSTLLNNELVQPAAGGKPSRLADLEKGLFTDFTQGALERQTTPTYFGLNGPGFFVLEDPDSGEKYYTRNGRFRLNASNELVDHQGYRVLDDTGAPIVVRRHPFVVEEGGDIFIGGQSSGAMGVVTFDDPHVLVKAGDGLYRNLAGARTKAPEDTKVMQSFLEASNVNVVEEMVEMISLNRNYESSQRALVAQDESLKQAVNQVSKF